MKNCLTFTALFCLSNCLFAQTPISGIINDYAKVTAIDPCEGRLSVSNAAAFEPGEKVILMQMQGAQVNTSNSSSFGNLDTLGSAGAFERNEVATISGSNVFLKYTLSNTYDPSGALQLISLPVFENATVEDTLRAYAWNGQQGGVLALEVENTLVLNAPLDVSGSGFRGGGINVVQSDCSFLTNADDYYYGTTNWRGAPKGEGVAAISAGKEKGRGAQANGGGGGNDHNSGGGGGANTVAAGQGGEQQGSSTFGCTGEYPGKGGRALPVFSDRIFMGGGGGAGHTDDDGAGSAGGKGGGIILIFAKKMEGNGFGIFANGQTPPLAIGDGAGGGGGGGSILLDLQNVDGGLFLKANGGKGGDVLNTPDRCNGPGGGGGGGRLISETSGFSSIDLSGGAAGVNTVASNQCNGVSNEAADGAEGVWNNLVSVPQSQVEIVDFAITSQPQAMVACEGQQVSFEMLAQGYLIDYQWQMNTGNGWSDLAPGGNLAGISTSLLTVFDAPADWAGRLFRVRLSSPCGTDLFSDVVALGVIPAPHPDFSAVSLGNGEVQFDDLSQNADSLAWDFGDGESSSETNPAHFYPDFGSYTVTLTAFNACGSASFSQVVSVETLPVAGFSVNVSEGCKPLTVNFLNQSSDNAATFIWQFSGGSPTTSTQQNPQVVFDQSGSFDATLIVSNSQGSDTLTLENFVTVNDVPQVAFGVNLNNLQAQFVNQSLDATGGYLWDFGDGTTSDQTSPLHIFTDMGFFEVTLTAFNECGQASASQTISTGSFPFAAFQLLPNGGCVPLTVQFSSTSSGSNLTSHFWEFEGGVPPVSNEENPIVSYVSPGIFDVKLTVANALGEHSTFKEDFVVVEELPAPDFTFFANELVVTFTNTSTDGTNFGWDFGDGSTSGETSPQHTYSNGGVYNVVLTAANSFCGGAISRQVAVTSTETIENEEFGAIRIFPNPAGEWLEVEFSEAQADMNFRLFDVTGKVCQEGVFAEKYNRLAVGNLAAGMYFLEIGGKTYFKIVRQ